MQARTARTSSSRRRIASFTALALCIGIHAGTAHAGDKIAADKLFDNGLKELDAGNFKAACDDFSASFKADPSVGALINLGKCNEKQGKLASAWSSYKDAISLARKNDDKRADDAAASVAALEPKLSTLKVVAKTPVEGLTISRDGVDTGNTLNVDLPIDPGEHTIVASAPGFKPATLKVNIGATNDKQTIEIPALVADPNAVTSGAGGTSSSGTGGTSSGAGGAEGGDGKGGGSGLMTAGFIVGGVGAAGMVVGAIFGGLAVGAKSDVKAKCPNNVCSTADGKDALSSAKTDANVATGGLVAGGILLAGGVVMVVVGVVSGKKKTNTTAATTWLLPMADQKTAGAMFGGSF